MSLWLASPYSLFTYFIVVLFILLYLLTLCSSFIMDDNVVSEDKGVLCLPLVLVIVVVC